MKFLSEETAVGELSDMTVGAAENMFSALRYAYALTSMDFYDCRIADVVRLALRDLCNPDCLEELGLRQVHYLAEGMNSAEYIRSRSMLVYSIAVRLPDLLYSDERRLRLSKRQLSQIYEEVIRKGGVTLKGTVRESFESVYRSVLRGGAEPFCADWYKLYIAGGVPAFSSLDNRTLTLFGAADMIFPAFYGALSEELRGYVRRNAARE